MTEQYPANLTPGARADLSWCHDAVQDVSRTFAITIDVLDDPMSSYVCVGYLLCRIADTVEDARHIPADEKERLLHTYDAVLDPADGTTPAEFTDAVAPHAPAGGERECDWRVVAETPRVFRVYRDIPADVRTAMRPPVRELTQGMAEFVARHADAGGVRVQDREELEEYCYYVAGTVGHLVTNLGYEEPTTRADPDRYRVAEAFGTMLQLVNIAKDVHDDYHEENNVYLPAEWLADEGIPQDDLLDPEHEARTAGVVARTANHAHSFLSTARQYIESFPAVRGNKKAAWAIPYLLAIATLRELTDAPREALSDGTVKVTREEVYAVIEATTDNGPSLADLERRVLAEPYTGPVQAGSR